MCRREVPPTHWLTSLPHATLIQIMQRRCSLIGGGIRASHTSGYFVPLTEYEIKQEENLFLEAHTAYKY